jgi:hypothetical protein
MHACHTQGEDLRVLPKVKLGANHWVFMTAAAAAAMAMAAAAAPEVARAGGEL